MLHSCALQQSSFQECGIVKFQTPAEMGLQNCLLLQFDCHKNGGSVYTKHSQPHAFLLQSKFKSGFFSILCRQEQKWQPHSDKLHACRPWLCQECKSTWGAQFILNTVQDLSLLRLESLAIFFSLDLEMRTKLASLARVSIGITSSRCAGRAVCWHLITLQRS